MEACARAAEGHDGYLISPGILSADLQNVVLVDGESFPLYMERSAAESIAALAASNKLPESALSNSLPRFRAYLAQTANRPAWETYASNPANSAAPQVRQNLGDLDIILARNADGLPRVNQSDYIANFFTRYRLTSGAFKGFAFGGGMNVLGRRLMALRTGFPADYSGSYRTFSALLSYERRWRQVTGSFQLNASNLFNDENFRYTSLLATGTPQLFRISDPRALTLTATFKL